MNSLLVILIALVCFLIGLMVGINDEPPIKITKFQPQKDEDLQKLQKEYENFLNYDGSIQE